MNRFHHPTSWTFRALLASTLATAPACAPDGEVRPALRESASAIERVREAAPAERAWFLHELIPSDDTPDHRFGWSVAVSGNTAVVGSPTFDVAAVPAAYVFVLTEQGWRQQAKLVPPSALTEKEFGKSVAISGDTIVVGAPPAWGATTAGAACVYVRSGTSWGAPVTLTADGSVPDDEFGRSVAVAGDTVVVGAPAGMGYGGPGAAHVFARSGSTWIPTRKLVASDGDYGYQFGYSLAVSDDTILVGSPQLNWNTKGIAYFFTRTGNDWIQADPFRLEPPQWPSYCCDEFGYSVALGQGIGVVAARSHRGRNAGMKGEGYRQGAAFVLTKSNSGWAWQTDPLFADGGEDLDMFGTSVAASGTTVLVGAPGTSVIPADFVHVFSPLTSPTAVDRIGATGEIDYFGSSVALDGDVAAVGTDYGLNGAYAAEFRVTDGNPCEANSDCGSRHCTGGVCCATACEGACEECSTGACLPVAADGSPASTCWPYVCGESGGGCPDSCLEHVHCVDTHYCKAGTCVPRLPNGGRCSVGRNCESGVCDDDTCTGTKEIGKRCTDAVDCATGHCVDGFCCDQRCDQQCEACDVSGARGTCSPVEGAPHGDRPACEGGDSICAGECDGEHTAGCDYPTTDESCGTTCAGGMQTDSFCDGQGLCEERTPLSCGNYECDPEADVCRTQCDDTEHCARGFTCADGDCEAEPVCRDDWTAQGPEDCRPYRCDGGTCQTSCVTSVDCADGKFCDHDGRCGEAPASTKTAAAPPAAEGCGCRVVASGATHTSWPFWVMALTAGALVRRRSRPTVSFKARSAAG